MPATTDTTLIENQEQPNQTQTTPEPKAQPAKEPDITQEGLDSMSQEELQTFARTGEVPQRPRDDKGRFTKAPEGAQAPAKPAPAQDNKPAPQPTQVQTTPTQVQQADGTWIEVEVEEGSKLRFRNQDELIKSFAHAQRLIRQQKGNLDKWNAERGEAGRIRSQFEQSQAKIQELSDHIKQLQQASAQVATGRPVTANPALAALQRQTGHAPGLDAIYQDITALRNDLLAEKAINEQIRNELTETLTGFRQKESEAQVTRWQSDVINEAKALQKAHPEYATGEDLAKINDLVNTYGAEAAQTMMSPADYEAYGRVIELMEMQYTRNSEGLFEIEKSPNFKNLEEALLVMNHRNGTLGRTVAQAHKAGAQAYENALTRNAQSATTLPNTVSGAAQPQMGPNEMDEILSMDPAKINASPELKAKFTAACKALGINIQP